MDNQNVHARLRANLVHLMGRHRLSQRALSRLADLDETTVKQILNGRSRSPRLDTVLRLAAALDVDVWRLIDGDPERSADHPRDMNRAGHDPDDGGSNTDALAAASDAERANAVIFAVLRTCRTHGLVALDDVEMEAVAAASAYILVRRENAAAAQDDEHIESVARNLAAIRAHRRQSEADGPSGRGPGA